MLTYIKIACAGIVLAIVAGFFYTYYSRGEKVETLTKEVTQVKIENKDLQNTVVTTEGSGKITEATLTDVADSKDALGGSIDAVQRDTHAKVEAIKRTVPKTPTPVADSPATGLPAAAQPTQDQAVSAARIDGLWDAFCLVRPANPGCQIAKP